MTERCFVKVKWDPASSTTDVRRAVGGFLRYIQHRDLHPDSRPGGVDRSKVAGLLKYVAYRDQASRRAELFCPEGRAGTTERKEFTTHVARSIERSRPQLFRSRTGALIDRRRSVSRFVISPEAAEGLDLEKLTRAGVARLEADMGLSGLRWIAAAHRNTVHHHVHLVLAGMREDDRGGFSRVDITKPRLAAMKEALCLEIERQRAERTPSVGQPGYSSAEAQPATASSNKSDACDTPKRAEGPALSWRNEHGRRGLYPIAHSGSIVALRAVARRYRRQMERELEDGLRRSQWERAA